MIAPSERAAFLAARAQGLGGSDCASLLQPDIEVKYGCARRLGLQKAKIEPDFQREESGPMRLGQILESYVCSDFAKLTGREVREVGRQTHPDHPELGGHVDRMQYDPVKGEGVVEAKCLGTRVFYATKRQGIILDYELQLAFYLAVTGCSYGSFVVANRDNLDIIHWDVPRNEQICEAIVRKGVEFWANVGNLDKLAAKLEPDDPRCRRCEYRIRCHASALLPSSEDNNIPVADELMPLVQEFIERDAELDRAQEAVAETEEIVMAMLGDRQAVTVHVNGKLRPLYWRPEPGSVLYKDAVNGMSVQYNVMKQRLIDLKAEGAELIPPPSSYLKRGSAKRPLRMQYLNPAPRKEG